jgi:hypothetical protein
LTVLDASRARMVRQLEKFHAPLGALLSKQWTPSRRRTASGDSAVRCGQILACSACTKVVGFWGIDEGDVLLDPLAGWVLERRRFLFTLTMCGGAAASRACEHCGQCAGGCAWEPVHEHPLACSDDCETALLADRRFDHCEPPFGYQRGGPHP